MKQLQFYIRSYLAAYFHLKVYLSIAVFLAVCIVVNYSYNFENGIVDSYYGSFWRWPMYFALMGFPFLVTCAMLYFFGLQRSWLYSGEFWLLFVFGFLVISCQRSFTLQDYLTEDLQYVDAKYIRRVLVKLRPIVLTVLPILLFYYLYERHRDDQRSWYGLNFKPFDFRPYAVLILVVFVGIAVASFMGDLTNYYPRYARTGGDHFASHHGLAEWVAVLIYESVYGLSFLGVEFFFRGFLVIGFARVLGGYAVLAMVGPYVFLHFGKPISECVSSAFGGYLIGILAYYSRHIWGGVVLHVALAWFMELFAGLQKIYNN
ncbi:hypothetical protein SAMN04488028_11086 [Reichenbachiella agariperforans]|uniref:CAAX protease self-immunity n=1 Tax=Reichenbachiella agariperforans TaxID=156994 RepID=A0A1M6W1H7_REIAG|nr:CPBP family glutamic-type intramembrane protease [Reichenbachiella agariperforans]SHK87584.1 hypothetical protein SAMN04488028_11086 [Reichenbachiella agariperforans]